MRHLTQALQTFFGSRNSRRSSTNHRKNHQSGLSLESLEQRSLLTAVAAPEGLVSWWSGNGSGADVMGQNNATLYNGTTFAAGEVGQAFSFDGVNDRADLGDPNSLKFNASMSIEGWVFVRAYPTTTNFGTIVFRGDDRGGKDPYSLVVLPDGTLRFEVDGGNGAADLAAPVPLGQLVHVAATLDDASGAMKLYTNGAVVAQQVTAIRPFRDLDTTLHPGIGIGNANSTYNVPLNGLIDELAMYSRGLTASEVLGIYKAGSDGKVLSPIAADAPSAIEGATGTTTPITFTLQRTGSLTGSLAVNWATADDTATVANSDYVAASGQVTFLSGEATKTVQVIVNGDNAVESNETFKLILTPVGGTSVMTLGTIVADDATISVSDASATEGSTQFGSWGSLVNQASNGGLSRSTAMAWGPDGNLYVGSLNTNQVLRFNGTTGAFLGVFLGASAGLAPDGPGVQGLQFRPDGLLYVMSRNSSEVQRFDAVTGAFVDNFIPSGSGGLSGAKGMTVGPDGNWYISSGNTNQVLRYNGTTGAPLDVFVAAGSGGLSNPRALTFGPDGNLYVTSNTTSAVLRYDGQTGAFLDVFVPPNSGGLNGPAELLFTNGNLYVASQNTNEILRYDAATGAIIDAIVPAGTGGLDRPLGLLLDANSNLLAGSFDQILRFGPGSVVAFNVSLSLPGTTTVSVNYSTANGTAIAGSDYAATSGIITFAPGEMMKQVLVSTLDDSAIESSETFTLNLSNAVGAPILDGQGVGTINDDDYKRQISITDATATEGNRAHYRGPFIQSIPGSSLAMPAFGPDGNFYTVILAGPSAGAIDRYNGTTGAFIDHFVPVGRLNGGRDMAFSNGYLYVGEEYNDDVLRFNATTGAFDKIFVTAGSGGIDGPHGLTFGPDANGDGIPELYVSGRNSFNVVRYDGATGQPLGTYVTSGSGGMAWPEGITFDPSGAFLYVASTGTSQILKYNAQTGAYAGVGASSGLASPKSVKFGPDGLMYVASADNNRILRFTAGGTYVDDYVPAGTGGMTALSRLTFGPDGDVYVTTAGTGAQANLVYRFGTESEMLFTVSLMAPITTPVTVSYSTADGTALAGSDFMATSGSVTFAPGETTKTIAIPTIDDSVIELPETFRISLSNAIGATIAAGSATGTILDNDTKFYVINDATTDQTFEYGSSGLAGESTNLNTGNTAPRGAASTAAGTTVWVADANRKVYVYNASGGLLGSWTAGTLQSTAQVEGITTNGTDVWIVDNKTDKVFKYTAAAGLLSGSLNSSSSFALNSSNTNPKGIVTDGTSIWVINDSTTDKIFKYSLSGTLQGSWTIDSANSSPTGLTIDPTNVSNIWTVDSGTDKVYQYTAAASRTSGSQTAAATFALAPGNTNPQDIADPPVPGSQLTTETSIVSAPAAGSASSAIFASSGLSVPVSLPKTFTTELGGQDTSLSVLVTTSNDSVDLNRLSSGLGQSKTSARRQLSPSLSQMDPLVSSDIASESSLDALFIDWSTDPLQLLLSAAK